MLNIPISKQLIAEKISEMNLPSIGKISIRELIKLVNSIELATHVPFIHMEMGVPGLPPSQIGIQAEIAALNKGVASIYSGIEGLPALKDELSRFAKLFMNLEIKPSGCIPTIGSMEAAFASFMLINACTEGKNTTLFIDPGFPVQKQQIRTLGLPFETFDIFHYRGEKLKEKLESYLSKGNISCMIYSNPNNPSWITFTEKELQIIGELSVKYDVIVLEDLAYFGMDYRQDYSKPGVAPFQPSVANYTPWYILMISGSKVFSYAGQRIAGLLISDKLASRNYPHLTKIYSNSNFAHSFSYGAMYVLTAGVPQSPQYAFAAMLKAANDGTYNFLNEVKDYSKRAEKLKNIFVKNGFYLVYDQDEGQPLADGFYFTVNYPNMTGEQLLQELLSYGVSAISLQITGSTMEGIRACVSQIKDDDYEKLEDRMKLFFENHPI